MTSIRLLMNSIIDYAGLFPPAGLGMNEAVRNYARYRAGEWVWALGRFIVPVSRLTELESTVAELNLLSPESSNWSLSVLGSADPRSDLEQVTEFNQRNRRLKIDAIELKVQEIEQVDRFRKIPDNRLEVYFEIPLTGNIEAWLSAAAVAGARAKVRTGGIEPDMFPSTVLLARFITGCAERSLSFKATAGLHHAFRSVHPLTYEASSLSVLMHGFLNVLVASIIACSGADAGTIQAILEERDAEAFSFEEEQAGCHGRRVNIRHLRDMRDRLFVSFGSCSFEEPVSEIRALGIL